MNVINFLKQVSLLLTLPVQGLLVTNSSPTPSPTPDHPSLHGGTCVTVIHFGCKRVLCHCRFG